MTSFSFAVQGLTVCVLLALVAYTLLLIRTGKLSPHLAVSWVVAEIAAIVAVVLWGRLPVIAYTSTLDDRELLVVLAVLFFCFIAFLMLDSLQRISAQNGQLRRLAQEFALLKAGLDAGPANEPQTKPFINARDDTPPTPSRASGQLLFSLWIVACVVAYWLQATGNIPAGVSALLTAGYQQ